LDKDTEKESIAKWVFGGVVTLTIGISAPLTTYFHGQRELKLEEAKARLEDTKHEHQARMEYLRTAINPDNSPEMRERVFRYLAIALKNDPLKAWADAELKRAEETVEALGKAQAEIERLRKEALDTRGRLDHQLSLSAQERQKLENRLVSTQEALSSAEARARVARDLDVWQCVSSVGFRKYTFRGIGKADAHVRCVLESEKIAKEYAENPRPSECECRPLG
jgi:hypothetical protein